MGTCTGSVYMGRISCSTIWFQRILSPSSGLRCIMRRQEPFLKKGCGRSRRNDDEALLAYLLGFGCHYILDSACHPYVNKMAAEGVIPHIVLEKEFDRVLMEETGKDPDHYYPACGIMPKMEYARVIHRGIPLVKTINIYISVRMMKFLPIHGV